MLFKTNKQKNITLKNGVGVGWVAKNFDEKLGWSLWTMELGKQFLNQVWKASYRSVCPATGPAGVPVQTEVRPAPDWGLPPGPRLHQGAGRAVLG